MPATRRETRRFMSAPPPTTVRVNLSRGRDKDVSLGPAAAAVSAGLTPGTRLALLPTPDMRRRFDLTPLGHPAWWAALALLLINDNLFKGRGVIPGWLAGKLSDFAFLIVAPVLFAAIIPRRVPGRRAF